MRSFRKKEKKKERREREKEREKKEKKREEKRRGEEEKETVYVEDFTVEARVMSGVRMHSIPLKIKRLC